MKVHHFTLLAILFLSTCVNAFALTAKLDTLDIEYDFYSDPTQIVCHYNFSWSTLSGSMTGFYYHFPDGAVFDMEASYALVNTTTVSSLSIKEVDGTYDVCLNEYTRYSGKCDYIVIVRLPKTGHMDLTIDSTRFDTSITLVILNAIFDFSSFDINDYDITSSESYLLVPVDKYGTECVSVRIEKRIMLPGENIFMKIKSKGPNINNV